MGSNALNFQTLISYTRILASHVNKGQHEQALVLFHHIQTSLPLPLDAHVFSLILKSCTAYQRPVLGTSIHAHVVKSSLLSNPYIACALVDFYGKSVSLSSARHLFDEITPKNVAVWNAMISLYTHSNHVCDALELFEVMDTQPDMSTCNSIIAGLTGIDDGFFKAVEFYRKMQGLRLKPDLITLLALLPACVGVAALNWIKEIHGYAARNELHHHPQLSSSLVEAYGRCGCLTNAHYIFMHMKEKDVVAWSSLISAYAINGEARTALETFRQMELAKVQPDEITFLGVLQACSHVGLADEAFDYFGRMCKVYGLEARSYHYSCLVDVLSRAGRLHEAYDVIRNMPVKATAKAWGALLGACQTYGELELAEIAGKALSEIEPENPSSYLLRTRMFASRGRYEEVLRMRREMKERGVKVAPGSSLLVCQD